MEKLPEIIFLDFDGVICESCEIKNEAYYNSYIKFGSEIAQKALDYHLLHGGVSRVKLFPIMHEMFLGRKITEDEHRLMCENFTKMVEEAVVKAPLTEGVKEFLENCYQKVKFFVSSGTPQDEMRRIVDKKGLSKYFTEILGSPDTKEKHILTTLKKYGVEKHSALFIGDATTDRDAAKNAGIAFIARLSSDSVLQNEKYTMQNFTQVMQIIKKIH